MLQTAPSTLVQGNTIKPFSGGLSSGHSGTLHIASQPVHNKDERQFCHVIPLRVCDESQLKLQLPVIICLLLSMLPLNLDGNFSREQL